MRHVLPRESPGAPATALTAVLEGRGTGGRHRRPLRRARPCSGDLMDLQPGVQRGEQLRPTGEVELTRHHPEVLVNRSRKPPRRRATPANSAIPRQRGQPAQQGVEAGTGPTSALWTVRSGQSFRPRFCHGGSPPTRCCPKRWRSPTCCCPDGPRDDARRVVTGPGFPERRSGAGPRSAQATRPRRCGGASSPFRPTLGYLTWAGQRCSGTRGSAMDQVASSANADGLSKGNSPVLLAIHSSPWMCRR
ncbi:hypothetical protein SAMN05444320_10798 [Streptoalloteichus hindustanus]|uniref:Uncharacterized protein n=1 Tax=Streptoalloteichus hindustanus TaxID=2017 RepID=A0A1M5I5S0_STRHI|nr:hypothetical protein SAMN05444320_10798 [Streptoalloteichus hindustanus]